MLDFIAIKMGRTLPMSLMVYLGLWLTQSGLQRFNQKIRLFPRWLFLMYWFALSLGVGKGFGPISDLTWMGLLAVCAPLVGLIVYIISLIIAKF